MRENNVDLAIVDKLADLLVCFVCWRALSRDVQSSRPIWQQQHMLRSVLRPQIRSREVVSCDDRNSDAQRDAQLSCRVIFSVDVIQFTSTAILSFRISEQIFFLCVNLIFCVIVYVR